jgi:PLP dependent protein
MFDPSLENLFAVKARMRQAALRANRQPTDIKLIAVAKTVAAETVLPLLDAGHRCFGENRVQEAQAKWPTLRASYPDIELHLIGGLQSNKAADAVALFDCIQTVDRPSLAEKLAEAMERQQKFIPCYGQVNIGDEAQKGGCALADLPDLLAHFRRLKLPVIGLMCIPPNDAEPAPYFALLHKLMRRHDLQKCSMGMSGDFETAIQLGATDIRVGSALFGERTDQ